MSSIEKLLDVMAALRHPETGCPWDLEQDVGLTEGNIFQGELSLEQLGPFRPVSGWSRYRTPINNLWMCGSCVHPGGGIMGSPCELAAKSLLKSLWYQDSSRRDRLLVIR